MNGPTLPGIMYNNAFQYFLYECYLKMSGVCESIKMIRTSKLKFGYLLPFILFICIQKKEDILNET